MNPRIQGFLDKYKAGKKLTVITAYDSQTAGLLAEAGVDALLVGDSLGMVFQGLESTAGVTLEQMAYHTASVVRGAGGTLVIADLPALTYQTPDQALENSRILLEAGADGVKFEGWFPGLTRFLVDAGVPVMGHLGLLPQTAGEFKVQGKDPAEGEKMLLQARGLQSEGAFSLVLECIPESLGKDITAALVIPTIGIGAGAHTSGQVLVVNDLMGFSRGRKAKFVPKWPSLGDLVVERARQFQKAVEQGTYPSEKESYH